MNIWREDGHDNEILNAHVSGWRVIFPKWETWRMKSWIYQRDIAERFCVV